jgi:hypothetical protein
MLRGSLSVVFVMAMIGTAFAADQAPPRSYAHPNYSYRAAGLPAGLPRPHYRYKTTITYEAPYAPNVGARYYGAPLVVYVPPEVVVVPYNAYFAPGPPEIGIGFPPYGCGPYGYYC